MSTWPGLMPERTARRYLGGLDPLLDLGVQPQFYRGERFYARAALDRAIDADRGLTSPPSGDDPDTALSQWLASDGSVARRP